MQCRGTERSCARGELGADRVKSDSNRSNQGEPGLEKDYKLLVGWPTRRN